MIKFFRKLRYDLMGKNKTGKYLKYALGEIILVVIGILIALSINNWNQNREKKSLLKTYTTSLIKDLQKDTLVLNEIYDWVENDNKLTNSLIRRLSSATANYDSLINIVRNDLKVEYKVYRPPNRNTLINIQDKGLLELYDDETYNSIIDLQATQNISEIILVANGDIYTEQLDRFLSDYVIGEYKIISGPLSIQAWDTIDNAQLFRRTEALLSIKFNMSKSTNILREKLLSKTVLLLNKLNEINRTDLKKTK